MKFTILPIVLLLFTGCATVRIPDFKAYITLPASGDGYWIQTVSTGEGRIPKAEWEVTKRRGIVILSEDWAILKNTVMKNCLTNQCKDTVGAFDNLFNAVDSALKATQSAK